MDTSPIIRFRIDREIAEKAQEMATRRGMELPDVMRMMLTRAVRIGDFSIDQDRVQEAAPSYGERPFAAYDPRYWDRLKDELDAEAALALLHRAIAERTAWLDENRKPRSADVGLLERVREERDEACRLLAAFDPDDKDAVAMVFRRFTTGMPPVPPSGSAE